MTWPEQAVVVVTGAAGGIGLAAATWFAERGARVFSLDREGAVPVVGDPVGEVVGVDVTNEDSVRAAVTTVVERAGRVDALVAGAGVAEGDTGAEDMTLERWSLTIGVNLTGVFLTCREFGRVMLEQGSGRIVAVASMSGQHVVNVPQRQVAYNASKAGVVAMVKSLGYEWAARGVRVNAVSPGYVDTPLLTNRTDLHPFWKDQTPAKRFATPEEVAGGIGYLLSDEAAFCVGTELLMDGGYALP